MNARRWWAAAAAVAWLGLIFFASTSTAEAWCRRIYTRLVELFITAAPGMVEADAGFWQHKAVHVVLFFVFAVLLSEVFRGRRGGTAAVLVGGAVVGLLSEAVQMFFPGRDPGLRDAAINMGATLAGVLVYRWLRRRSARNGHDEAAGKARYLPTA